MRTSALALVAASVCCLLGSAVANAKATKYKTLTTINLAINNNALTPGQAFVWVGQYLGYYKQEGINLNVVPTSSPPDAISRLVSGEVQVAIPPAASIIQDTVTGNDLGLEATFLVRPHGQYEFAVPQNSPITSFSQLIGKKIGVSNLADEGVNFTQYEMSYLHQPRNAATIVPVGQGGAAATELSSGEVDALALPLANFSAIGSLGIQLRFLVPSWEPQAMGNMIWMKKSYIAANKSLVQRFIDAYTKSQLFYMTNPKAATEITFKMYPTSLPAGTSEAAAVAQSLPATQAAIPTFKPTGAGVCHQYGCFNASSWSWYLGYLGYTAHQVNASTLYTNEFIKQANSQNLNAVIKQAKHYVFKG
jgi:NitT/TauT family transport system substrate-binding protein